MDEYTADVFVNRDEPIPVLTVTGDEGSPSASASDYEVEKNGKRQRLRKRLSASRLAEKARQLGEKNAEEVDGSPSLQERLFNRLLAQIIPPEDADSEADKPMDRRSSRYVKRPAFSLPLMTNNFRRFNARIGIVFVFQNRLIRLFTWKTPSHTLSFLSIYTFVCLDPHLLVVIPLAALLLFVMVPAFLARHPPPPPSASTSSTTPYSYYGPALAPPRTIKPASEASKDFFRNMRDLQNSMADFATLHDSLIKLIAPPTNFSNEVLSSSLFLFLSAISASLFISAHLLPWRFIFLGLGFTVTASGHPAIQAQILHLKAQHDSDHRAGPSATSSHFTFGPFTIPTSFSGLTELLSSVASITLSTAPETREVEIFELQYRPLIPPGPLIPSAAATAAEWNPYIFTPSPYDPLSPARISGSRPPGCRFFEDVQPPRGWVWKTKKWELDLQAGEWVADRLVTGVGFEVSPTVDGNDDIHESENKNDTNARQMRKVAADVSDQFGGWVWDLPPTSSPLPALGSEPRTSSVNGLRSGKKSGGSRPRQQSRGDRDWEESTTRGPAVAARTGEWRRRRWVRMVQRVGSEVGNGEGGRDEAEAHKGQAKIGKRN